MILKSKEQNGSNSFWLEIVRVESVLRKLDPIQPNSLMLLIKTTNKILWKKQAQFSKTKNDKTKIFIIYTRLKWSSNELQLNIKKKVQCIYIYWKRMVTTLQHFQPKKWNKVYKFWKIEDPSKIFEKYPKVRFKSCESGDFMCHIWLEKKERKKN